MRRSSRGFRLRPGPHRARRACTAVPGSIVLLLSASLAAPPVVGAQQITVVLGGDVEWSRETKAPDVYWDPPQETEDGGWHRIPHINSPEGRAYLESRGRVLETPETHHVHAIHYGLEFDSSVNEARYPFRLIGAVLREADVAFLNLETPLSDGGRWAGAFRTPTSFADGLRWAGVDVVATANNHALDSGGDGLMDTLETLWRAGIGTVGTGRDIDDARRPFVVDREGIKIAFLGYANYVNLGTSGFATSYRSGVVPLDPLIIEEDVRRIRDQVDHVLLSFHWGIENTAETHPEARGLAKRMLDAGADVVFGHGAHLPRGVETFEGKLIVYSPGNFVFGHNHTYWGHNYLVRLTLTKEGLDRAEIIPIAGEGNQLAQPYMLQGEEAGEVLRAVRARSAELGTAVTVEGDRGYIRP